MAVQRSLFNDMNWFGTAEFLGRIVIQAALQRALERNALCETTDSCMRCGKLQVCRSNGGEGRNATLAATPRSERSPIRKEREEGSKRSDLPFGAEQGRPVSAVSPRIPGGLDATRRNTQPAAESRRRGLLRVEDFGDALDELGRPRPLSLLRGAGT